MDSFQSPMERISEDAENTYILSDVSDSDANENELNQTYLAYADPYTPERKDLEHDQRRRNHLGSDISIADHMSSMSSSPTKSVGFSTQFSTDITTNQLSEQIEAKPDPIIVNVSEGNINSDYRPLLDTGRYSDINGKLQPKKKNNKCRRDSYNSRKRVKESSGSLSHFWQVVRPERGLLLAACILQIINMFGQMLGPLIIGAIIDVVSNSDRKVGDEPILIHWACQVSPWHCGTQIRLAETAAVEYVVIAFATSIVTFVCAGLKRIISQNVLCTLRGRLFESLIYQDIAAFDDTGTGAMLNRLAADVTEVGDVLSLELTNRMGSLFLLIGCCVYVTFLSWKLTLALYTVFPFIAFISKKYGHYFKKRAKMNQNELASASEVAAEALGNIRTVRAFSREDYHVNLYWEKLEQTRHIGVRMAWARGQFRAATIFLDGLGISIMLFVGARLVVQGELDLASFTTFILYAMKINSQMKQMVELFTSVTTAIGATERVFKYIETEPEIDVFAGKPVLDISGRVHFQGLSFCYPTRPDQTVLNNFNLKIEPNTVTALVGVSGSGKSTITQLLMRFYDPMSGQISIDDQPLKDLSTRDLHRHMSVVSQEPVLFRGSIGDNIKYGIVGRQVSNEELEHVCKQANAHKFITAFPNGYNTDVGERGVQLSGGQKQRIAIARALLMQPKILILDEATSALDAESEHLVDSALKNLMENRTTLLIAHRLSTVQSADKIVVLRKGKIIEFGTHDSLLKANGFYAFLFKRQTFENTD